MKGQALPVGISDFNEIRQKNCYYVDKTGIIEELINAGGTKVTLITRPRRFGKTLGMSMLECFFDIRRDSRELFKGLKISGNTSLCEQWMNKYPTVFLSFKDIDGRDFASALDMLRLEIAKLYNKHDYIIADDKLNANNKKMFESLADPVNGHPSDALLKSSIALLISMLHDYYGKQVIVLLDEYDVPIAKANSKGYYDEMLDIMRSMLSMALKDNSELQFAVVTGCMRLAKESIFTGLNMFKICSITDVSYDEYFGFKDDEVRQLLRTYGQQDQYDTVKEWYDGYRFGDTDVYCPWDVLNYADDHITSPKLGPKNYWVNTSGNDIIEQFIKRTDIDCGLAESELEDLVNGETVTKEIHDDLTYKELYESVDNIWSALFMTGYLTQRAAYDNNVYELAIPNREVQEIITDRILKLFKANVEGNGDMRDAFCDALARGDAAASEQLFNEYLSETIGIHDTCAAKDLKERFYHGILLGILSTNGAWTVRSNKESGIGYADIMVRIPREDTGLIIEVKYAEDSKLDAACDDALRQIDQKDYAYELERKGVGNVLKYAFACNRKRCRVMLKKCMARDA